MFFLQINIVIGVNLVAYTVKKFGDHRERRNYAKTKNAIELGNLLDIQKNRMNGLSLMESKKLLMTFFQLRALLEIYHLNLAIIHLKNHVIR